MPNKPKVPYLTWVSIRTTFEVVTTIAMLGCALVVVWQIRSRGAAPAAGKELAVPRDPLAVGSSSVRGDRAAKAALLVFSDFQCPFCGRFAKEIAPTLIREYVDPGRVLLVFRNLPLEMHKNAVGAAEAATCAGEQGKFWGAHDWLFDDPSRLSSQELQALPQAVGLDATKYGACRAGKAASISVERDKAEALRLGVAGTPAFLLGRLDGGERIHVLRTLTGVKSVDDFRRALNGVIGQY